MNNSEGANLFHFQPPEWGEAIDRAQHRVKGITTAGKPAGRNKAAAAAAAGTPTAARNSAVHKLAGLTGCSRADSRAAAADTRAGRKAAVAADRVVAAADTRAGRKAAAAVRIAADPTRSRSSADASAPPGRYCRPACGRRS